MVQKPEKTTYHSNEIIIKMYFCILASLYNFFTSHPFFRSPQSTIKMLCIFIIIIIMCVYEYLFVCISTLYMYSICTQVISARNIVPVDCETPPDTYVKCYLKDGDRLRHKKKTRVVRHAAEPTYKQTLKYQVNFDFSLLLFFSFLFSGSLLCNSNFYFFSVHFNFKWKFFQYSSNTLWVYVKKVI